MKTPTSILSILLLAAATVAIGQSRSGSGQYSGQDRGQRSGYSSSHRMETDGSSRGEYGASSRFVHPRVTPQSRQGSATEDSRAQGSIQRRDPDHTPGPGSMGRTGSGSSRAGSRLSLPDFLRRDRQPGTRPGSQDTPDAMQGQTGRGSRGTPGPDTRASRTDTDGTGRTRSWTDRRGNAGSMDQAQDNRGQGPQTSRGDRGNRMQRLGGPERGSNQTQGTEQGGQTTHGDWKSRLDQLTGSGHESVQPQGTRGPQFQTSPSDLVPRPENRTANVLQGSAYDPSQPKSTPRELSTQFRSSSQTMREAMSAGKLDSVDREVQVVRERAASMRGRLDLNLEQRLRLNSIMLMYDQGTASIEDGRKMGQEAKVKMGLETIEKANRTLEELSADQ